MNKIKPKVSLSTCNHPAVRILNSKLTEDDLVKLSNKYNIDLLDLKKDGTYQTIVLSAIKDVDNSIKPIKEKGVTSYNKSGDWVCFCSYDIYSKEMLLVK